MDYCSPPAVPVLLLLFLYCSPVCFPFFFVFLILFLCPKGSREQIGAGGGGGDTRDAQVGLFGSLR